MAIVVGAISYTILCSFKGASHVHLCFTCTTFSLTSTLDTHLIFWGGGVGFFFHTVVGMSGFHDFQGGTFLLEVGLKCATGLYLFNTVASCMFPCYTRLCVVKLVLKNCTVHFPLD